MGILKRKVKYRIIGKHGSFITSKKNVRSHYKVGDWTNATGTIKHIYKVRSRLKKKKR